MIFEGGFKSTKGFVLLLFYLILLKSINENKKNHDSKGG